MAIWRDPLDELIEDLEKAVPAAQGPIVPDLFALEDMRSSVGSNLAHSSANRVRASRASFSARADSTA